MSLSSEPSESDDGGPRAGDAGGADEISPLSDGGAGDSRVDDDCALDNSCVDAGPVPCDLSACAPEATCKVVDGVDVCACPSGYWGDGLSCTRNECHSEQAGTSVCGARATCEDPSAEPGDFMCTCDDGYADCDDSFANGCETNLNTSPSHCGACGETCAGNLACVDGRCEQVAAALVLGEDMTCALLEPADARGARRLRCWGSNAHNRLRTGNIDEDVRTPITVAGLDRVRAIGVGTGHVCALEDDSDAVYCWGRNSYYQLGTNRDDVANTELIRVSEIFRQAAEVGAGWGHTCVRAAGRIHCWGSNFFGQLGTQATGMFAGVARSQTIGGILDAVQLSVFGYSSCARRANGRITCWGGFFPNGPSDITDAQGRPIEDFVHLTVGNEHACGVRASGEMGCWGSNRSAQLGTGSGPDRAHYLKVPGLDDVLDAAAGFSHTCAVVKSGQVNCWGENREGTLATDSFADPLKAPTPVPALNDAIDVEAGASYTCARLRSGQVVCWGENANGQLGDGTAITPPAPVNVVSLP